MPNNTMSFGHLGGANVYFVKGSSIAIRDTQSSSMSAQSIEETYSMLCLPYSYPRLVEHLSAARSRAMSTGNRAGMISLSPWPVEESIKVIVGGFIINPVQSLGLRHCFVKSCLLSPCILGTVSARKAEACLGILVRESRTLIGRGRVPGIISYVALLEQKPSRVILRRSSTLTCFQDFAGGIAVANETNRCTSLMVLRKSLIRSTYDCSHDVRTRSWKDDLRQ